MEETYNGVESVTLSEILGLDSWNQPRTSEDLQSFINRKHQELATVDVEDEELQQVIYICYNGKSVVTGNAFAAAQLSWLERETHKLEVTGSIPVAATTKYPNP